MITCKQCGNKLIKNKTFCSKNCRNKYLSLHPIRPRKRVSVICEECGKKFDRKPSDIKNHIFCSRECYLSVHTRNKYEIRHCKECNKDVRILISGARCFKNTFCSRECHDNWRRKHQRGKHHHQYNRLEIQCAQCSKQISVIPAKLKINEYCFCSNECRYNWNKKAMTGSNNPAWQGGYDEYYGPNWIEQRNETKMRDNYECQNCGLKEIDSVQPLQVHHVIPFRSFNGDWFTANNLSNLMTLCQPCHQNIEWATNRK